MKKYLFLALLAAGSLTACKKDSENPKTRTELLIDKNWIVTAQTISPGLNAGNGVIITDIYSFYKACDRDDFLRFEKPNVVKSDEGATKCTQGSPQTETATWTLTNNDTIINITDSNGTVPGTIAELSDNALKVTGSEALNGTTYTVTTTYRKG